MDHVKAGLAKLWAHPRFVPTYLATSLLVGTFLIATNAWPTTLTDEDDYVPYGFSDLTEGRNPYATGRNVDRQLDPTCTWHDMGRCWYSLPYLPLTLLLWIPGIDYRWTALAAFVLLAAAVRDRPRAFLALANPLVLWLAVNGFTDIVVAALIAWSMRLQTAWPAWLAAATKQFALPLVLAYHAYVRDWKAVGLAALVTGLLILPFFLRDPGAFLYWTVTVHLSGSDHKWWGILGIGHPNYLLYYALAGFVFWPEAKRARTNRHRAPAPAPRPEPAEDAR